MIMVCIRKNLKVHTQELKPGSNDIHETGRIFKSRFKTYNKKSEVVDGEFEFAITLRKEELLNHDNCTWLSIGDASGDASTPSSCSKDNGLFGYTDLKIDAWFISLLSTESPTYDTLLNTKTTFFDGSQANPMEEAYLILDQMKVLDEYMVFHENLEEEEVVSSLSWLENESSDNYQEQSYGQTLDIKSNSNSKRAFFDNSDVNSLISSAYSSDHASEIMNLKEISAENPLFEPFNLASDSGPENKWDFFDMSPRKKADNSTKNMNILATEVDSLTKKYDRKLKIVLEDLLLVEKLNVEGVIIEQVLGLGEFDGHEGIESEFNKDHFSIV